MLGANVARLRNDNDAPERILLTPEKAVALLEHNQLNRPLSQIHVERIARQIKGGKWKFNGDTIKVADTGDVLDGQHRLWAIIEARKPVDTIIVYNIERDAFATIDTLRRLRSGADVLALSGVTGYRHLTASALRFLIVWQRGVLENFRDPKNRVENSDVEEAYANHPGIINAVQRATKLRSIVNPGLLGFFYYVLTNRNAELAERMMNTLESPGGFAVSDPFFKLRNYFLSDHHRRKEPLVSIALMIKAANAAHHDQKIQVLNWKHQGKVVEAFPTLEVG